MLILGAKGHATEILSVLINLGIEIGSLAFYDNITNYRKNQLYFKFLIIRDKEQAIEYLASSGDPAFCLGIGNPKLRYCLANEFKAFGRLTSVISKTATIGCYQVLLGPGLNIMEHCYISNDVTIGEGSLINAGAKIHHGSSVGKYCEISPGAIVLGRVKVGNFVQIGANATILPDVFIGNNAIVGAGAVVTKNVEADTVVVGVPAKVVKK